MEFNELIIGATYLVEWDKEKMPSWYHGYLNIFQRGGCSDLVKLKEKKGEQNSDDRRSPYIYGYWKDVRGSEYSGGSGWCWNGVKDCFIRRAVDR